MKSVKHKQQPEINKDQLFTKLFTTQPTNTDHQDLMN